MKKNVFIIDVSKLKQDVDFRVVTNTLFYDECMNQFYEIPNHHLDRVLLDVLQLGIVKICSTLSTIIFTTRVMIGSNASVCLTKYYGCSRIID